MWKYPIWNLSKRELKDFIKFPRAIRRQVNIEEIHGFEDIYINGPVLKVEIIAIYK